MGDEAALDEGLFRADSAHRGSTAAADGVRLGNWLDYWLPLVSAIDAAFPKLLSVSTVVK
jgi:hypothetical protein